MRRSIVAKEVVVQIEGSRLERKIGNCCIIPARGGSKRIPRKNVRSFCGKPIIAWTLDTVRRSGLFERVIVSTDDEDIARVAREHGADVPFMRPLELAGDHIATRPVVNHAIAQTTELYGPPEKICVVYPTAALMVTDDLQKGWAFLQDDGVDFAFSATDFAYPIQRALYEDPDGHIAMLYPEFRQTRSQDLVPAFHDAGQFYWGRPSAFLAETYMYGKTSRAVKIPIWRSVDIDTEEDWFRAEQVFRLLGTSANRDGGTV